MIKNEIKIKKIMVLGDIMLDRYINCDVHRISPEAPIPVLKYCTSKDVLGGAANVASNLAENKQQVQLVGTMGFDEASEIVLKILEEKGIGTDYIFKDDERITTTKTRYISNGQQIFRVDKEDTGPICGELELQIIQKVESCLSEFDLIVLSDYMKGFLTSHLTLQIIQMANRCGIPVIVDPKDKDAAKYKGCTLIKPNKKEMEAFLGGRKVDEANAVEAAIELKAKINCEYVLLTLGPSGMFFVDKNNTNYHIPSEAKEIYDVTGAGDTVLAFVAMGFGDGELTLENVIVANKAAGVKVSKFGTAVVTINEILEQERNSNIRSFSEIGQKCIQLKKEGKKIVFTNGCFDILHPGHVQYLEDAKRLGDVLILGLNSDASVRRLKGEERPIFKEDERSQILGALSCVDYVVIFDEDTPLELIKVVKPDLLAKGGDYIVEDIVGYDEVIGNGGDVVTLPFIDGKSTTNIVDKIKNLK